MGKLVTGHYGSVPAFPFRILIFENPAGGSRYKINSCLIQETQNVKTIA
jgi:hypothetical protein